MRYVVNSQVVLLRPPEGPLASHIAAFATSMSTQGYCLYLVKRQAHLAACFSQWLMQRRIVARQVRVEHVAQYLKYRVQHSRMHAGDDASLKHFICFLRSIGAIPADKVSTGKLSAIERCIQAYEQYLFEARALARATIVNYVPFVRTFLRARFGDGQVALSRLTAGDVVHFVQRQAPHLHRKRAKTMTSALRSFLRYARFRGDVTRDLAAAVPIVPNWSMTSIPRAIASDQVRLLLASIDRRTAIGRRDYAILLLLARLGLRAGEVTSLELDDIDWNIGKLTVRGKTGQRSDLPLSSEVGKAIAAYLRRGRPQSNCRRVFLRAKAPIDGFRQCGIVSIVRHSIQRAGIKAPTMGAHQFRHGLAIEMLRHGASLGEIGDLLGHQHPDTTRIYAKVDLAALRKLAMPWPGGVQ